MSSVKRVQEVQFRGYGDKEVLRETFRLWRAERGEEMRRKCHDGVDFQLPTERGVSSFVMDLHTRTHTCTHAQPTAIYYNVIQSSLVWLNWDPRTQTGPDFCPKDICFVTGMTDTHTHLILTIRTTGSTKLDKGATKCWHGNSRCPERWPFCYSRSNWPKESASRWDRPGTLCKQSAVCLFRRLLVLRRLRVKTWMMFALLFSNNAWKQHLVV